MLSSHTYQSLCEQPPTGANRKGFFTFGISPLGGRRVHGAARIREVAVRTLSALVLILGLSLIAPSAKAQCSVCSRTAQQMGEKPAKSLNTAIVYLMVVPFGVMGFIGFRWWRNEYKQDS